MSTLAEQVVAQLKTDMDNVYDAGYQKGKSEGGEEIFFTNHGTMYQRNMYIDIKGDDGIYSATYKGADKLLIVEMPFMESQWSSQQSVFAECTRLERAYLPRILRIGNLYFQNCTSLEEVTLGSEEYPMIDIGVSAFNNCTALKHLKYIGSIPKNLNLQWCPLLAEASIQNIIDCLIDLTGETTQTLTVHADVEARMSDEQKATITSKNWTLAVA